jgi:hypothetical protein
MLSQCCILSDSIMQTLKDADLLHYSLEVCGVVDTAGFFYLAINNIA